MLDGLHQKLLGNGLFSVLSRQSATATMCDVATAPAARRRIHTFLATSDLHLERKLRISRDACLDDLTRIQNAGKYLDLVVRTPEGLRFQEKICVFDSVLVPNSLIYPV